MIRAIPFLVLALVSMGCDETAPTAPTVDQLEGTWQLVSIRPAGQSDQVTPADAVYSLSFDDGRLSARADCNTCNGAYALSGFTLTVGPALACTRAACRTIAFETEYTRLLAGDSTVGLSGDALLLSSPRGVLRFSRDRR
jgi:heat shock protein HslJ